MLRSIKELYADTLGALDGEVGRVKDFYFDDLTWAVRYLVADTGNWLPGRQVLISPYALGCPEPAGRVLRVDLTRKQIEGCPSIANHKPVSRQYEEDYFRYYNWPFYWQGGGLWGVNLEPDKDAKAGRLPAGLDTPQIKTDDRHLRSTQAVSGYHLRTSDGTNGHVCDFMVNPKNWAIPQLAVKIGHRFSGKEVLIPTSAVTRISYDDSAVFVNLTSDAVERSPEREPALADQVN